MRTMALLLLCALVPVAVAAQDDGVRAAEELVRGEYYEALPYARARALTPAGVARLAEMLAEPGEASVRPNLVAALGMSEGADAYPALAAFAHSVPQGAVDSAEYRARLTVPIAMGHLARSDPRALVYLQRAARSDTPTLWTYRHLDGERLGRVLQRAAISGLGVSGLSAAERTLRGLRNEAAGDPGERAARRAHIDEALGFCDRVRREGAAHVFAGEPEGEVVP
jgi:hypothetical protein